MGAGYAVYLMMLSTGWIFGIVVAAMGYGFFMAVQAIIHGK